ncbi:glycosyl transferase [Parafrankia colletiae]|uniref:dolichyl-phosphate beta-glucosyltransferase n=1 Tax=Parafrankia colletiae TaxID=573497 RepID=A0A1S1RMH2_9ACTN|nr:bifunctional glycosyltransferase family 2/GtrA family protein [Parafrankia colletiae]MCK9899239.1 bifunctional glycosyltransferase family 2/GtrA family protein [Frankia sp. Cpl3]OHV45994.1 glycosyl transferase [Parafrankia colletiae]
MAHPVLDVVIPVYNEEKDLAPCIRRLHAHLRTTFPYPFQITVADNASTDTTLAIAQELVLEIPEVSVIHLDAKGRGRALRAAWGVSTAPVLAYMDVDLSTDLAALLPLVAPLISGHSDLAIGTRLSRSSRVVRGPRREVISRCYNLLLRGTLAVRFTDAQCGFKAIRADVAACLLPLVQDGEWFFDTEMLVIAQRSGLRIHEVPVDWIDDPDSRVDVLATAMADLRGVARLARALGTGALPLGQLRREFGRAPLPGTSMSEGTDSGDGTVNGNGNGHGHGNGAAAPAPAVPGVPAGLTGQLLRFAGVGVASTLAYLVLFVLLRGVAGAQAANLVALLVTAVANTAANRRLTFGVSGRDDAGRHHLQGLFVFAIGLALTSGSLAALHAASDEPGRLLEVSVLVLANLASTVVRFLLLRAWVFHPSRLGRYGREVGVRHTAGR